MLARSALSLLLVVGCSGPPPVTSPAAADGPALFTVVDRWQGVTELPIALTYGLAGTEEERELLRTAVLVASEAWSASGALSLRESPDLETADVSFSFEEGDHGACPAFVSDSILAHAGPSDRPTFVHFNRKIAWGEGRASLATCAAHELGHVLGLGHSDDPDALMFVDTTAGKHGPGPNDLAGLHSLYGGGVDGDGDVALWDDRGEPLGVLRRVAPRDRTNASVLDTDGDGDEELLVWRMDEEGIGALSIYHFDGDARLERTVGPLPGIAHPGAKQRGFRTEDGERLFVAFLEGGRWQARYFDEKGLPRSRAHTPLRIADRVDADGDGVWDDPTAPAPEPEEEWFADLDGDGRKERLALQ